MKLEIYKDDSFIVEPTKAEWKIIKEVLSKIRIHYVASRFNQVYETNDVWVEYQIGAQNNSFQVIVNDCLHLEGKNYYDVLDTSRKIVYKAAKMVYSGLQSLVVELCSKILANHIIKAEKSGGIPD